MLPKNYRLPAYLIPEILRRGKILNSLSFRIFVLPNTKKIIRIAVIVPIKLEKRAVKRNKIKRLFKETIRINLKKIKKGTDLIFLIKKKAMEKNFFEIKEETEDFLIREKIMKDVEKNHS